MISFFFFNDTATTEIYTLSLHDALPISNLRNRAFDVMQRLPIAYFDHQPAGKIATRIVNDTETLKNQFYDNLLSQIIVSRSEEHTSELQSRQYLVCRLLLEKKKNIDEHH